MKSEKNNLNSVRFLWVDDLFECVFNLAYKLAITPFGVIYNSKEGNYIVTFVTWRKWVSFVFSLATATLACVSTSGSFAKATIRSPSIIFSIAPEVGDQILCCMFWYVTWMRQSKILSFFTLMSLQTFESWRNDNQRNPVSNKALQLDQFFIRSNRNPKQGKINTAATEIGQRTKRNLKNRFFPTLLCFLIIFLIVGTEMLKLYGMAAGRFRSSPSLMNILKTYFSVVVQEIGRGLRIVEMQHRPWEDLSTVDIITVTILLLMTIYFKTVKAFAVLMCIAGVAVIFKNSCELKGFLNGESDQTKVMQTFQSFKEFVEAVNEITGPLMFGIAILCAPTFYVANLAKVLIQLNFESPSVWLTMTLYGILLLASAEVTTKTDEYREWILECGEGVYEHELFGIFVDLTQNPVGVRGMECFTITHSFLAQMLSCVVTFTIILLQFMSEDG